jgi:glycosyltransferase involved in cell wall biosynthesis
MTHNILIVTQYFYPENFRINTIAKLLVLKGHTVTVLTGCPNYPDGKSFDGYSSLNLGFERHSEGFIIHRVPIITRGQGSSLRLFLNYLSFIVSGILFGRYTLRNTKFDLVFVYAPSPIFQSLVGIYFKQLRGVPVITWVQDLWPECLQSTGYFKNKAILNLISKAVSWTYRQNNLLLTQSKSFISSVKLKAGSVPVKYFANPGDENLNQINSVLPTSVENFFLSSGFNIVFAGNIGKVQSLPTIIAAAEILRDKSHIRFIFFGSGSQSEWLKHEIQIRRLNNIILAGRYPPDAMPEILNRASALLVSLISDPILNQTVPAKLQSYLAAGKPIIASLDGDGAQIVTEARAGFVCPTQDPIALTQIILKLSDMSHQQLDAIGAAGNRYFAENFEPHMLVEELISMFTETISNAVSNKDDNGDNDEKLE